MINKFQTMLLWVEAKYVGYYGLHLKQKIVQFILYRLQIQETK